MRKQIVAGFLVEARLRESRLGLFTRRRDQRAAHGAQRFAEFGWSAETITVPERQPARLAEGGHNVDTVVRDLHDAPRGCTERKHVIDARFVNHLLIELAHAGAA